MTGLRTTTLAVIVAVLGVAPAAAAPIGPLSGSAGCVAQANSGNNLTKNCAVSKGLSGADALAITPDGGFVYAAAGIQSNSDDPGYGAVSVLKRDPNTGGLTEVACISSDGTDGRDSVVGQCDANAGLLNADAIAVSPDAKNVYAATYDSGSVVGFARDPSSGKLTELACFQENVPAGSPCYTGRVFRGSDGIAVSPDNSSLYVGSSRRDAISELLASEASSGGTPATSAASVFETPPPNNFLADPCIATAGLDGACDRGSAMRGVESLVVSPDGRHVYASATRSGAIVVFTRDSSGKLTQSGCLMHNAPNGLCGRSKLLSAPGHMAMSADGRNLYVVDSSTLVILQRDPTAGSLSEVGCIDDLPKPQSGNGSSSGSGSGSASSAGRVRHAASDPCESVPGFNSTSAVAIGPDDATVYTAGDGSLLTFSRNATTGKLTETSCDAPSDPRCSPIPELSGVEDAKVSPDGRNLYLASAGSDNGVFAFGHGASAAKARVAGRSATLMLACPSSMRAPCSGRLELVSAVPPKRRHGRWPLTAAGRGSHFRLRPGQRHRFRVGLPAALLKQIAHGQRVRVLAVSIPDPGGGGALARIMVLSR